MQSCPHDVGPEPDGNPGLGSTVESTQGHQETNEDIMLNKTVVLGLALALALGATTPGFAKKARHAQPEPTAAQNSLSAANPTTPGSRPVTSPEGSPQAQCWIPVDNDRAYGYYGGCDRPRARQMK